jgi:ribosomal-protein-serine acetyltransferase
MRVTFPRLPDHQHAYAMVERDDGVVYRLSGGVAGPRLPHDIVHLVVERELRITDGIWAGIASGVVFTSMTHVSGRRPPHAAERSARLLRQFRDRGLRAELMADLVSSTAALNAPAPAQIRKLAATKLSVLPDPWVDPAAIARAARALQVEAARWARLRVGEQLSYEWDPRTVRIPRQRQNSQMGAKPAETIERGQLELRRVREDFADDMYAAVTASLDHLRPWMPWAAGYTRQSGGEFLAKAQQEWADGTAYNYAIMDDGAYAGGCSLMSRIGPGGLEIGYWVHAGHTNRGLATRAAAALTDEAFALPGIDRVEIVTDELNHASAAIPPKLGFTRTGTRPIDPASPAGSGTGIVWRRTRPAPR